MRKVITPNLPPEAAMRHPMLAVIPLLLVAACADQPAAPTTETKGPSLDAGQGGVVHRVSVGGPDMCFALGQHPGCDGNLSLIAIQREDGSVTGQWSDASPNFGNVHIVVDCLNVVPIGFRPGLQAWVGGVVDVPASMAGHRAITRMRDNGTSMNDPLTDAISFSELDVDPDTEGLSMNCHDHPAILPAHELGLARVPQGQVTIW
jgi:hypothetical protein